METQELQLLNFSIEASTKTDRELYASNIIDALDRGEVNPLKAHIQLKAIEDIFKRLTDKQKYPATAKRYSDFVLAEAQKHSAKKFEMFNATVEVKEAGTSYDYSLNPSWVMLDEEIKQLSEKKKALEKTLQTIPAGKCFVDPDTGETFYGPSKTSTTTTVITLK